DLLYSFGSFMTVCTVHRNNAETRVAAMLRDDSVNPFKDVSASPDGGDDLEPEPTADRDLEQDGRDQITDFIRRRFKGHGLARIVDGILRAQGMVTRV